MNKFKVYIRDDYSGKTHIVITYFDGRRMMAANKVNLVFEEIPEGTFFKEPTIEIGWADSQDFKAAFKEALDGEKLPASAVEGELKATKYHLEDMRKIVDGYVGLVEEPEK